MFELVFLAIAFIGSSLAAFFDLKTTEIPDKIPHTMIALALILYSIQSILSLSYWPILNSLIAGLSLLGFGFLMYFLGQWGGGDAKVLAAIGFLLPQLPQGFTKLFFPFPLTYLINVFIVGAAYMLIYAFVLALLNKKIILKFLKDMKANAKILAIGSLFLFILFFGANLYFSKYTKLFDFSFFLSTSLLALLIAIAIFIIWRFAKTVEEVGFKKKISISKLKVGDVLLKSRLWEGITEKELKKIKKSGKKYIQIKEGVRFAPSFVLALLFTLFYGDGILIFLKFLI
jgi:Flp pilus assembly protein protease CpaA